MIKKRRVLIYFYEWGTEAVRFSDDKSLRLTENLKLSYVEWLLLFSQKEVIIEI